MLRFLRLAARNLGRNGRRTAIAAAAILFGVSSILWMQGFADGLSALIIEDTVLGKVGAIQIHKRGFRDADRNRLEYDLAEDRAFVDKLRAVPGVIAVAPRISFDGMLGNGSDQAMFVATAIDPTREYDVCPARREGVSAGGRPIEAGARDAALLGAGLAEALDAKTGSGLSLLATTRAGTANALDVTVQGLLPSRFILESKRTATVPLAFAQDLLKMEGRFTEYALRIAEPERAEEVAAGIRAAIGDGYEVETWREIAPAQNEVLTRIRVVLGAVTAILFILVAAGIANAMLMSVLERVREIGTMLALGARRSQVLGLFLAEAGLLGLIGAAIGVVVGVAIVVGMNRFGVEATPPGGDVIVIRPITSLGFVLRTVAFAVGGTVLAGLVPAWRGARLHPASALRSN